MVFDGDNGYQASYDIEAQSPVPMAVTKAKSVIKSIVTAPGNIVGANVKAVLAPLYPVLILALIGGYIYFSSKKVSVNVER
jgi:hypothetical protein